ncbi:MAG: amino acid permease [Planctomycetes bacterium]|nr:amino acid permease [Planctomycetota bacterium]
MLELEEVREKTDNWGEKMVGKPSPTPHKISIFSLIMISSALVISVRNIPVIAEVGLNMLFFAFIAAVAFLIPVALVSAELATGWPKQGGVYVWVREAFGERWGFLAIWLQWAKMFFGQVIMLSFVAGSLAYVYDPALAQNKVFLLAVILIVYWGATFANLLGMKISGWISTVCIICGVFIPAVLIISFGIVYLLGSNPTNMDLTFTVHNIFPDAEHVSTVTLLAAFIYSFTALEVSAVHANDVENPQRSYPVAIFISGFLMVAVNVLGAMAVGIVVPRDELSLLAGLMEAFDSLFHRYHISWLIPFIGILVGFGAIGQISTWIVGPARGMLVTAQSGNLPPFFHKVNKRNIPTTLLVFQASLVSVSGLLYLFVPGINSYFWMLLDLTILLYLIMYILMFLAAIRLRYKEPDVHRAYKVPGGNIGMWVVVWFGLAASCYTFFVGFFPPEELKVGSVFFYEGFLGGGILIMVAIPMVIYQFRKPGWAVKPDAARS